MSTPRTRGRRRARPGFSLLEITLVLVIIGMLMAVAAVSLLGSADRAAKRTTKISMGVIQGAIKNYMIEHAGTPPQSLDVLVSEDYLEKNSLEDSWDERFYYSVGAPGSDPAYQLVSNGPDKTPGTDDDISIWDIEDE